MSEEDITRRFDETEKRRRDAGQFQPWPNPDLNAEHQHQLAESPTRHTMPDERPDERQGNIFADTPQPHERQDQQWPNR